MIAPKPLNYEAMCNAWNNPTEFARQVAIYYAQLGQKAPDITEPRRKADA